MKYFNWLPFVVFLLSLLLAGKANGQAGDTLPGYILRYIKELQTTDDSFYQDGMIPSQRWRKKKSWEDNNVFFTALTVFNLRGIYTYLSPSDQLLADTIILRAQQNYADYQNRNGDVSYNFWETTPSVHFPNSKFFSKLKYFILPDDMDVTAMVYLSAEQPDSNKAELRELMTKHTNLYRKKIRTTFKRYKNYEAYNTWFGKKMPLDFDICVMANVMYYVYTNHSSYNEYDSATLALICEMVRKDDHFKAPHHISTYYKKTNIILYHLARLLSVCPYPELQALKPKILADIRLQLDKTSNELGRMLLLTSLYRLGTAAGPSVDLVKLRGKTAGELRAMFKGYVFFVAHPFTTMPGFLRKWWTKGDRISFKYQSEGYYWSLLLEYYLLQQRQKEEPVISSK